MKQVACVFIAFGLIAWILLSNVSSVDYSYGKGYYSEYESGYESEYEYESESNYKSDSEYDTQHDSYYEPDEEEERDS